MAQSDKRGRQRKIGLGGSDTRPARKIAPATARRELVVLSAAIRWCFSERLIDRIIPVKLPPQSEPRSLHLTRREAAALIWGALGFDQQGRRHPLLVNRHVARFILIGLYTGTRHHALINLQWRANTVGGWFDLDAGILYRRPEEAVESAKRRPALPIPPRLLPHLRRWQKLTATHVIECRGKPVLHALKSSWHSARQLAGLPAKVTPHVLRHTCATWLLQEGVTMFDTSGVLGCGEDVIRKTYGHHAKENLRAAVAVFGRRGR
jgi:integrase